MLYYAGIGSQKTPSDIMALMTDIAQVLNRFNITLRSGGAQGADTAFEQGAANLKQIFLPWSDFEGRRANGSSILCIPENPDMFEIAKQFHPAWHRCSPGAQRLHARNVCQILGPDLQTPTDFVVCWTPNGSRSGGTGQALRMAEHYNIPIFDLALDETLDQLEAHIRSITSKGNPVP